ncbi:MULTISPECIES: thiamine pyrophosphate-dependent enzyme [Neoroseomonas]|uniref:Aldehyde dehydrogenase n=2 Tax=Neoroseomonas TaxID=2870716 RepID=A0A9X9WI48_9PROT|nr:MULTISPECIES: thiamine pyrophosphate-dependent enzyme [Neoroseomonas]MBR0660008.1 aldehyde dehydrogenase [Neoroseomonas oryzicola]NKE19439.1 aldehyde dehydrogenase [Neoroseomonas oryzicola]NMJ43252.1 aldehyde dehydrogenase [Neoroseomonas marina]
MLAESGKLDRRELTRALLEDRGEMVVIAGLGAPAWDITAVGDHPLNLPLWGGMGAAAMIGLGLALAQPNRRVLVLTGDGEMLMGIGALATIAVKKPRNLSIVVQDNEHYGETGMQETATKHGVDLVAMAKGAGFPQTMFVTKPGEVPALKAAIHAGNGPFFAVAKIDATSKKLVLPPRDGAIIQARMREAILGPEAHHQL